jgi:carboxyl-terminal processing protease
MSLQKLPSSLSQFSLGLPFLICALNSSLISAQESQTQDSMKIAAEEKLIQAMPPTETSRKTQESLPLPFDEVRIFAQVLSQIREAYVEETDDKTLLENAIKGMLAGIDPHSTYLPADEFAALEESTSGEFGGLGVEVGIENGFIKIIAPLDDSPADKAGIKAGDLIIKLDDTSARDVTLGETSDLLRGDPGTDITLTIMREGVAEPLEITIIRDIIKARSVRSRTLEKGYGYLRITHFSANTGDEVLQALFELQEANQPLKGLVMDLRNNPGGVLGAAVAVSDVFLDEGLIVYTEGRIPNTNMRFEADAEDPSMDVPLIVLIDGGSASASEIVAGALQDQSRAIIMGTQSFGKGSVQTVLPVTNDRAIKLTTALYYTPSGRSIQARGITPDIVIDRARVTKLSEDINSYREVDLAGHLQVESKQGEDRSSLTTEEVVVNDYQLNEAVNLLKGMNLLKR